MNRLQRWLRMWPVGTPESEPETTSYDPRLEHPEQSENRELLRRLDAWPESGANPGPLIRWAAAHLRGCIDLRSGVMTTPVEPEEAEVVGYDPRLEHPDPQTLKREDVFIVYRRPPMPSPDVWYRIKAEIECECQCFCCLERHGRVA